MATTQYIGARYVPVVYGEWVQGVQYEPLTIVTYLNQSYTSKKPVPATVGNPADNGTYWALTGAYNAQISQLTTDVDRLRSAVNGRKKVVSIGASINLDTNGQLSGGFPDKAFSALGYTSDDFYNIAYGGAGFVAGNSGQKFIDQLQIAATNTSADFKAGPGRIIVTGGMNNDINNGSTYLAAVDAFVTLSRSLFPNFTIEFLPLSWSRQHSQRILLRGFYESYIKAMPDHGIDIWPECYAYIHNYVDWFRDNIHFSQDGIDVAAHMFMKILTGTSCDFNPGKGLIKPLTPAGINEDAFSSLTFTNIREYYDGNMVWLFGGDAFFRPVTDGVSVPIAPGSPLIACDNPFHYISTTPFTNGQQYGEFPCGFRTAEGNAIMDGFLFINTSDKLAFYARQSGFTLTGTGSNILKMFAVGIPREFC